MGRIKLDAGRIDIIRNNLAFWENEETIPDLTDDELREATTMRAVLAWVLAEIEQRGFLK